MFRRASAFLLMQKACSLDKVSSGGSQSARVPDAVQPLFDRDKIIVLRDFIPYEPDHMTIHATHVEGQIFRALEEAVGFLSSSCFDDVLGEPEAVQARTKPKACEFRKRRTI